MENEPTTRLGWIMREEGRKQTWLAKRTFITANRISLIVQGMPASREQQESIAAALGRPVSEVFETDAHTSTSERQ